MGAYQRRYESCESEPKVAAVQLNNELKLTMKLCKGEGEKILILAALSLQISVCLYG